MTANAAAENQDMKISHRIFSDNHHPRPLFVTVSKFDTECFPVRVRHLRLGQIEVSKTSPEASSLERRIIPQRRR